MNRMAQMFRMLLGVSLFAALLGLSGCTQPETISFDEFLQHVQGDKISEVTIIKPASEDQPAKVEGRYRGSIEGKTAVTFVTEGKVDQGVVDQLKASGVIINFK